MYSAAFEWNVLYIYLLRSSDPCVIQGQCLIIDLLSYDLSLDISGVFKSPYYYYVTVNFSLYVCDIFR